MNLTFRKEYMCWDAKSNLPYNIGGGRTVVLENDIHVLGGTGGNTRHYKYNSDTDTWTTNVSTLPLSLNSTGEATVLNGEIHIFYNSNNHYSYNPNSNSWTKISTTPFTVSSALTLDGEIHILNNNYHYRSAKIDGQWVWVELLKCPYYQYNTVFDGTIYNINYSSEKQHRYDLSTNTWEDMKTTNTGILSSGTWSMILFELNHTLYSMYGSDIYMYETDDNNWVRAVSMETSGYTPTVVPYNCGHVVVMGRKLCILGSRSSNHIYKHYHGHQVYIIE